MSVDITEAMEVTEMAVKPLNKRLRNLEYDFDQLKKEVRELEYRVQEVVNAQKQERF